MSTPSSSGATSPSNSTLQASSASLSIAMGRSGSGNRHLFRDGTRMTSRSRRNTLSGTEDVFRNLGSDYQEIQKRTLTKWVNAQLEAVGDHINAIDKDLKDGKRLLKLLSVVSKEPAPKPERMNMRIHQLANVAQALTFMEKQLGPDAMPDIGNEAIVNGDEKKTLALIFFIMLRYQIQPILTEHGEDYTTSLMKLSERLRDGLPCTLDIPTASVPSQTYTADEGITVATAGDNPIQSLHNARKTGSNHSISEKHTGTGAEAKGALLYWVRIQLEDYIAARLIPPVQDFSRSWRTGLAFCLLIHRHDPDLLPDLLDRYAKADLTLKTIWFELLELAFDNAYKHLGIHRYLEPEDLVEVDYPHEPSVMMYVSEYYKVMSRVQREEPEDIKRRKTSRRRTSISVVVPNQVEDQDDDGVDDLPPDSPTSSPCYANQFCSMTDELDDIKEEKEEEEVEEEEKNTATSMSDEASTATIMTSPALTALNVSDVSTNVQAPVISRREGAKRTHRLSSLCEEDRERIKNDLNNRLLRQLTGHLPRGVHPVLDQLLNINDTLTAFIQSNTNEIETIPDTFAHSSELSKWLACLDSMITEAQKKETDIDLAREARDVLCTPPETADDTLIRLTDLQRTQVAKVYEVLVTEWTDFGDMIQRDKEDLLEVHAKLCQSEHDVEGFEQLAISVEQAMATFALWMQEQVFQQQNIHPLDGTMDTLALYQGKVKETDEYKDKLEKDSWQPFQTSIQNYSSVVQSMIVPRRQKVEDQYRALAALVYKCHHWAQRLEKGMQLSEFLETIRGDLHVIQKQMDADNHTTEQSIQDLEKQVTNIRSQLYDCRETYAVILEDERCQVALAEVDRQYERVRDWVDQVRQWFVEAERIRSWIETRVKSLQAQQVQEDISPLNEQQPDKAHAEQLQDEHEKLRREVDRFNADDMARLRAHVKTLTQSPDRERELSPADTSTIEITLTTLTMLDQLLQLLRKRTQKMEVLKLRIAWEEEVRDATDWIKTTNEELAKFSQKARWSEADDDNHALVWIKTGPNAGKHMSADQDHVIRTLVDLEERIAVFDKSNYTNILDIYQDMEDVSKGMNAPLPVPPLQPTPNTPSLAASEGKGDENNVQAQPVIAPQVALPDYLEQRQLALEASFEKLMARSQYCRRIVEQRLVAADVMDKFIRQRMEGEKLYKDMTMGIVGSSNDEEEQEQEFQGELVDRFRERADQLITQSAKQIIYPVVAVESEDYASNESANRYVHEAVEQHAMELAVLIERLGDALSNHQQALSLQQRAGIIHEDILRMIDWIKERCQILRRTDLSLFVMDNPLWNDEDALMSLENEYQGIRKRFDQAQQTELPTLFVRERAIEEEMDECNTTSIDRMALVQSVETLEQVMEALRHDLDERSEDLGLLRQCIQWDKTRLSIKDAVNTSRHTLLDIVNAEWDASYPTTNSDSSDQAESWTKSMTTACDSLANVFTEAKRPVPVFIQQEQELSTLSTESWEYLQNFVTKLYNQRDVVKHILEQAQELQKQGEVLCQDMTLVDQDPTGLPGQWKSFQQAIFEWNMLLKSVPYPIFDVSNDDSTDIQGHVNSRHEMIKEQCLQASQDMEAYQKAVESAFRQFELTNIKQEEIKGTSETIQVLDEWMNTFSEQLGELEIHLDDLDVAWTEAELSERQTRLEKLGSQLEIFDRERMMEMKSQIEQLRLTETERNRLGQQRVLERMGELRERLAAIQSTYSTGIRRVRWQAAFEAMNLQAEDLGERVRQLTMTKNTWMVQDALTLDHIEEMERTLGDIQNVQDSIEKNEMDKLNSSMEDLVRLDTVPESITLRMDTIKATWLRLQNHIKTRAKEVEIVQRRVEWQAKMQRVMTDLETQQASLDTFVAEEARWDADAPVDEDEERHLRDAWAARNQVFASSQEEARELSEWLDHWQADAMEMITAGQLLAEPLRRERQAMETRLGQMDRAFAFARDIVTQRCLMSAFILRTQALKESADHIRDSMLDREPTAAAATETETDAERVSAFKESIVCLRDGLAQRIPLPVRTDDDIPSHIRIQDETLNTIVEDTISTQLGRLEELCLGLESLINSQEQRTRRAMALNEFRVYERLCEQWLSRHNDALTSAESIVDKRDNALQAQLDALQHGISVAESVGTAMKAKDNVWTRFVAEWTMCRTLVDNDPSALNELDASHRHLLEKWQALLTRAGKAKQALTSALTPVSFQCRARNLLDTFERLDQDIDSKPIDQVTDDHIAQWQKRVDQLEAREFRNLQSDLDQSGVSNLCFEMDEASERIVTIRSKLMRLYDMVNLNRLRHTFMEQVSVAVTMLDRAQVTMEAIETEFKLVSDAGVHERLAQHQALVSAYRELKSCLSDCGDACDDLDVYYGFIQAQGGDQDVAEAHAKVEQQWETVQAMASNMTAFVSRASKWKERYDVMDRFRADLEKLHHDVLPVSARPLKKSVLDSFDKRVGRLRAALNDMQAKTKVEETDPNQEAFYPVIETCTLSLQSIQDELDQLNLQLERTTLLDGFSADAARLRSSCEDQLRFIRQQSSAHPDMVGKRAEAISHIIQSYNTALTNIRNVYNKCRHECDHGLKAQANRLVRTLHVPPGQVDSIYQSVEKALQELNTAIKNEVDYIDALKGTAKHARLEAELAHALSELRSLMGRCNKAVTTTTRKTTLFSSLGNELASGYEKMEEDLKAFYDFGGQVKQTTPKAIGIARVSLLTKTIDRRQDAMRTHWLELKPAAQAMRGKLAELQQRNTLARHLGDILRHIHDLRDKVKALHLSGKNVTLEIQELRDVEDEMNGSLASKITRVDELLANLVSPDRVLAKQREQLATELDALKRFVQARRIQARTEDNLSVFFSLMERLDESLTAVTRAIDEAAPQRARVVDGRFHKSDLQQLLRQLVSAYKERGNTIEGLLTQAQAEVQKQFKDLERVTTQLKKTRQRWTRSQASAAARERELQMCIEQLDHEFFTKLAKAKNAPQNDRRQDTTHEPHHSSRLPVPNVPFTSVPGSRRSSIRSLGDGDATRRSKTPSTTKNRRSYVPDPKNELDMQVSKVVNESTHHMKVRRVPGEVGKYWFGDDHPRLMYCRILPSKQVMLRVGGGWVELSKFLRDHGQRHDSGPRPTTSGSSLADREKTETTWSSRRDSTASHASSSQLSQSTVHSHTLRRSKSPMPPTSGYKQGDQFIRIDEDGHQVAMKLTKAKMTR